MFFNRFFLGPQTYKILLKNKETRKKEQELTPAKSKELFKFKQTTFGLKECMTISDLY
jgi:hypothetical protein